MAYKRLACVSLFVLLTFKITYPKRVGGGMEDICTVLISFWKYVLPALGFPMSVMVVKHLGNALY
ncbi:hypothetical protein [Clostridium sp. CF012]|uniref:hypothetical protein n=1 Tax=Clostridium sp. CF012 TaxID=2843319 RepID=UPI001C0C142A|nr:hypothetical protein [Clostridium sp. CF012]MBU3145384.1 hypothetical protein [Clostridium sp. CF012]